MDENLNISLNQKDARTSQIHQQTFATENFAFTRPVENIVNSEVSNDFICEAHLRRESYERVAIQEHCNLDFIGNQYCATCAKQVGQSSTTDSGDNNNRHLIDSKNNSVVGLPSSLPDNFLLTDTNNFRRLFDLNGQEHLNFLINNSILLYLPMSASEKENFDPANSDQQMLLQKLSDIRIVDVNSGFAKPIITLTKTLDDNAPTSMDIDMHVEAETETQRRLLKVPEMAVEQEPMRPPV